MSYPFPELLRTMANAVLNRLVGQLLARAHLQPHTPATDAPLLTANQLAALIHRTRTLQGLAHVRESYHRQAGDLRSAYLGSGLDFEESRIYQPGDDVHDMDWRTTARTHKPHIKIYRQEHQPALHIVIDRGPSMRYGTRNRLKVTQAARIATLLGFAAASGNTCIGGSLWQPDSCTLPCRNGETGAMQLIQAAITPCPPFDPEQSHAMQPFADLLTQLDAILPRGSRVVLISDFHHLNNTDAAIVLRLASHHQLQAIQVLDPTETALPNVGLMRFQDAGSALSRWVDTGSLAVRSHYQQLAERQHHELITLFRRSGVHLQQCFTDADPFRLLQARS